MPAAPAPQSWEPTRPFRYVAGDVALDFVNTVDWAPAGLLNDRLTDYARLVEWAEGAGLVDADVAGSFRSAARSRPREADAAIAEARALRQTLHQVFAKLLEPTGARAHPADTDAAAEHFSRFLRGALSNLSFELRGEGSPQLVWPWQRRRDHAHRGDWALLGILWPVARAAAATLTSGEASRIRTCAGQDCGWMFVDRSRNGRRRWCEMETCGTIAKERRRASKRDD